MLAADAIKLAAVVASGVSIVVTILLFVLREWVESSRRRTTAATTLALYAVVTKNSLVDHTEALAPVDIKEVLRASQDVIHFAEGAELLFEVERTLRMIRPVDKAGQSMSRASRDQCVTNLSVRILAVQRKFNLSPYFTEKHSHSGSK